jgi:hypothetical protein
MQHLRTWKAVCRFHDAPLLHEPIRWAVRAVPGSSLCYLWPVFGCDECLQLAQLAQSINVNDWE